MSETRGIEIFISYSHRDQELRDELEKHLRMLNRQGTVAVWYDRKIDPSEHWEEEIDRHLNSANLILLLITADYLASDYHYNVEIRRALERHAAGEAKVIPIILRPVDWQFSAFAKLQALPRNGQPVTTWSDRDEAFSDIAKGIRNAVEEISQKDVSKEFDLIKSEILSICRKYKSIPLLEIHSISGFDIKDIQRAVQQLEREDFVRISNPGNILEEIVTAKRKAFVTPQ
jgi:TIR domain